MNLLIAELKDSLRSVVEFVMLYYELLTEACNVSHYTLLDCTLLLDKGALKTIASPSHRAIVLADSIAYRTIGFLRYRPNLIFLWV